MQVELDKVEYAGFWVRVLASILDTLVQALLLVPILLFFFGTDMFSDPEQTRTPLGYLLNYGFPLLFTVLFWKYRSATPGKIMMGLSLVDARTGAEPPTGRLVLRYLAYYVSALPLGMGFFWVAFDRRKRGFHDMIADTLVIKNPPAAVPGAS